MINILLTSVSNKVLLVESFQKALASQNVGGRVIGIDTDPYSAALYFCDEYRISPRLDHESYFEFIIELCKQFDISLIVPTRDQDVLYFSQNKSRLIKQHDMTILTPEFETVKTCDDKYLFYQYLKKQNISTIESWERLSDEIPLPCILKKRKGAGTEFFLKLQSRTELEQKFSETENLIIQEYIRGTEYTIDYFADFQSHPISIVPRVRYKVVNGESKVGITIENDEIVSLSKKVGQSLGLIGHNIIQCFRDDAGEVKILEVNPRFGGGSNLSFAAGANTPEYLLQILMNRPVSYTGYKKNLTMIRYSQDLFLENDPPDIV